MKLRCVLLLLVLLAGCERRSIAPSPRPAQPEGPVAERRAEARIDVFTQAGGGKPGKPATRTLELEKYSVTVSANETLPMPGPPGELRVWIGDERLAPRVQPGMNTQTLALESRGETARVKPFALGLEVEPRESVCEKITPTGSEVRFALKPSKLGTFTVGANVELFGTPDCSGAPVPKTAKSVTVKVVVSPGNLAREKAGEAGEIVWKRVLEVVGGVAGIISVAVLWRVRKKIFKLFGYPSHGTGT
ncbi:hypothetical protein ACHMW6_23880 [Pseudoduganella sp. UC29_106]|uniref:hypothetical protein n=1 Tax=Pseudoduganella sp. UC29_106 TaxID=3374553 RepID=UPI00375648C2